MKTSSMISTRVAILSAGLLVSALSAVAQQVNPFSPEININPSINPPKSAALFLNGADADTGLTIGYGYDPYVGPGTASFTIDHPTIGNGGWSWRSAAGSLPETTPMFLNSWGQLSLQAANPWSSAQIWLDSANSDIQMWDPEDGGGSFQVNVSGGGAALGLYTGSHYISLDAASASIIIDGRHVLRQSTNGGLNLPINGGRVGIGTNAPTQSLDVVNSSFLQAVFRSTGSGGGIALKNSGQYQYEMQSDTSNSFIIYDRNTDKYRLNIRANGMATFGSASDLSAQLGVSVQAASSIGLNVAL